nr:hypothetical protein [Collinsella urealyticum]
MQANTSFFVTDPNGTLIREIGGAVARLSYEIRAFDTIDFSRSMRFNPIAYIRDEAGPSASPAASSPTPRTRPTTRATPTGKRSSGWSTPRSRRELLHR